MQFNERGLARCQEALESLRDLARALARLNIRTIGARQRGKIGTVQCSPHMLLGLIALPVRADAAAHAVDDDDNHVEFVLYGGRETQRGVLRVHQLRGDGRWKTVAMARSVMERECRAFMRCLRDDRRRDA